MAFDSFQIVSPIDGSVLDTRPYASKSSVQRAIDAARASFPAWRKTTLEQRITIAKRWLETLGNYRDEMADLVTRCMGRPRWQADEFDRLRLNVDYMIDTARQVLAPTPVNTDDKVTRFMCREPLGICLSICAWNYPVAMTATQIFAPILAGNPVLFKHAPQTAPIADYFQEAFVASDGPRGVFQSLDMSHADAETLIGSGKIQALQFIGSLRGGQRVKQATGSAFVSLGLELGGKDPAYIRPDVNIDQIVPALVEGSFGNAGQSCCSVERIYVHRNIYPRFLESFTAAVKNTVTVGNPFEDQPYMGPVVSTAAAARIYKLIEHALRAGATPLLTTKPLDLAPAYVAPQILANCGHNSRFMQEEVFGPAVGVLSVASDDEAITLMNDSEYGLTASIWTEDLSRGEELGLRVDCGTFYVNRCDHADPHLAWGGVKQSGMGRSYGPPGFDDLTTWRSFHVCRSESAAKSA